MSTEHTPGPWHIVRGYNFHRILTRVDGQEPIDIGTVNMDDSGISDDEAEANARLIAAAPELLATSKEAALALRDEYNLNRDDEVLPNDYPVIFAIEAAIAKAIELCEMPKGGAE